MALRLGLLDGRYRADRDWTDETLAAATERLERWRAATALPAGPDASGLLARVRDRLSDDLDTPAALAAMDRWAAEALTHGGDDEGAPRLAADTVDALLGVRLH
jgi:L-cysteine:1D-myo-inositol 2-amino-2-deoxy-alpha-D-glucopyranoside ligase